MTALEHHYADLAAVRLHYVTAGSGPPLVLLHGWPQTWYAWRRLVPLLAPRFRLVMPDLRGLGDSSRPETGYDKRSLAEDIWQLLAGTLGIRSFYLAGHDWGGPVAYALAAAHRDAVLKLAILDVAIPGDGNPNISQGGRRWHHAFHGTRDLPEALVAGREALYLGWFYENYGARPDAIPAEDVAEYLRTYTQPGALRAGFEFYRAIAQDIADNQGNARLTLPVLAVGGAAGWGRGAEVEASLRRLADDVTGQVVEGAGHWIPEEQPELLARLLQDFFVGES